MLATRRKRAELGRALAVPWAEAHASPLRPHSLGHCPDDLPCRAVWAQGLELGMQGQHRAPLGRSELCSLCYLRTCKAGVSQLFDDHVLARSLLVCALVGTALEEAVEQVSIRAVHLYACSVTSSARSLDARRQQPSTHRQSQRLSLCAQPRRDPAGCRPAPPRAAAWALGGPRLPCWCSTAHDAT